MDNFDAPLRHPLKSALCSLLSSPPLLASPSLKYTLDRVPDPSSDRDCFPFAVRRAVSRVRGWTLRGARATKPTRSTTCLHFRASVQSAGGDRRGARGGRFRGENKTHCSWTIWSRDAVVGPKPSIGLNRQMEGHGDANFLCETATRRRLEVRSPCNSTQSTQCSAH